MLSNDGDGGMDAKDETVATGIQFQFDECAAIGQPVEVAEGVWWVRLPIDSSLQYVNVYCLRDGNGLTLIDTGVNDAVSQAALESALASNMLASLPLKRIIVTHFHPDHIGLAGVLARKNDASVWMTRTCWLSCKLLIETASDTPKAIEIDFMRLAGLSGIELEAYKRQPANRYSKLVAELPEQFMPLIDNQEIQIGNRTWRVVVGHGHAAEHLTLWSDSIAIVGDQILPSISANLTVPFTEPEIDLIAEWKASCVKLSAIANNEQLCLPGHQRPYKGIRNRLEQIQANIEIALQRLAKLLARPSSALDCLEPFHNRQLSPEQRKLLLPELVGFLNHLRSRGEAERRINSQGVAIFHRLKRPEPLAAASVSKLKLALNGNQILSPTQTPKNPETKPALSQSTQSSQSYEFAAKESSKNLQPQVETNMETLEEEIIVQEQVETSASRRNASVINLQRMLAGVFLAGLLGLCWTSWDRLANIGKMTVQQVEQFSQPEFRIKRSVELTSSITPVSVLQVKQQASTELPRRFTGILKPQKLVKLASIGLGRWTKSWSNAVNESRRTRSSPS